MIAYFANAVDWFVPINSLSMKNILVLSSLSLRGAEKSINKCGFESLSSRISLCHQSCQNTSENKKTVVSGLLKVKVHGLERLR